MIARLGRRLSRISTRVVPDPFVLALALTGLVLVLGLLRLALSDDPPAEGAFWTLLVGWAQGFSSKPGLAFALQMCLVLVTGHALALSPPVQRAVVAIARLPRSGASAAALVAAVAAVAGVVHWGLGAIVGAFLAREIARHARSRGLTVHYPLLGAAAYTGLAVWHGGLSGSAPLKVAESGHFAADIAGVVPVSATLLSPLNLLVTGSLVVLLPLLYYAMSPRDEQECVPPDPVALAPLPERKPPTIDSVPTWLRESPVVGVFIGAVGLAAVVAGFARGHLTFDLNLVNLLFLFLGLSLQGRLGPYVDAVADGARGAGAIILQFPFYFGILGVMKVSGMIQWISDSVAAVATTATFPGLAFATAGLVNLVVPSGGGQWAVQGEILLQAGSELGIDPGVTVMAFAYGDAWTNMLQPFWALPLLGIMGLRARDIIGYTAVAWLAIGVLVPALLFAAG
jgi:short-chain fatty acids transporter